MTLATATAKVKAFFSPRDAIVKERSDLKTKLAASAAARQAFASLAIPALP